MRFKDSEIGRETVRYIIVGVLTTVVSLLVYYLLVLTILDPSNAVQLQIANCLSWIAAVSFAYITNRKYVFRSTNDNILKESAGFFLSRIGTLLADMLLMFMMVTVLAWNDKLAKLLVQGFVLVANYLLSKLVVFREKN